MAERKGLIKAPQVLKRIKTCKIKKYKKTTICGFFVKMVIFTTIC
jgi:hypothetical protein